MFRTFVLAKLKSCYKAYVKTLGGRSAVKWAAAAQVARSTSASTNGFTAVTGTKY